jgi:HD superfamily phosphohydrolase YqeK
MSYGVGPHILARYTIPDYRIPIKIKVEGKMILPLTTMENTILELAKPYLLVMSNDLHTKEVVRFCLKLLAEEGGNRKIVIAAAILHDVGWSQLSENLSIKMRIHNGDPEKIKIHEELGARIAEGILRKTFHEKTQIEEILKIIEGHDTRKIAISLNDKIVKDADKLSRYSKGFFNVWHKWGTSLNTGKYFAVLKQGVKEWFFLPSSRRMAGMELYERIQEFRTQDCHPEGVGLNCWKTELAN